MIQFTKFLLFNGLLQAGVFDPYSDDPRLAVKKLALCPITGVLAAAGTAGQIVIVEFSSTPTEKEIPVSSFGSVHCTLSESSCSCCLM